ncbi:MSMEG_0570 family nitrogen starvation response protein [Radicibacter daui]|uniref:MSMEG_0570 family nitrogen starvation response protein n=1 Tax=Radicibacter daui TaxID=3064829 RepID=UPI004046D03A
MPEVWFTIRWPDGDEERCYSPSSVICDHLHPGQTYGLTEFRARARSALQAASDRVEQKYGYPCSRARGQLALLEQRASRYEGDDDPRVTCLTMKI